MRAATCVGMTFVDGHIGPVMQSRQEEQFKAHIVESDPKAAENRHEYRAALISLGEKLETLLDAAQAAGETAEAQFWQMALDRLRRTHD